MSEEAIRPFRATLLVLMSAAALAALTLLGVRVGHPFLGALLGYAGYIGFATHAFRSAMPDADRVLDGGRVPPTRDLWAK